MNLNILLQKLIDIEKSIGVETTSTTRRKVLDAQEYLLRSGWRPENPVGDRTPSRFSLLQEIRKTD